MAFQKKPKKEIMPWRQGILSHHTHKPNKADRGEFPVSVIKRLKAEANGKCQACRSRPDTSTHHIMPKGRMSSPGRGVYKNGLRVCDICHDRIQTNEEELQLWITDWKLKYGDYFWFDDQDWEEHQTKQSRIRKSEDEKKQRMKQLAPILNLISTAAGRKVVQNEISFINRMDDRDRAVFEKIIKDVIPDKPKIPFGYGHFDD
jgi:hypothetical protein